MKKGLPFYAYLPSPGQKAIQKSLYDSWPESEDGVESLKRCEVRSSRRENGERNMKSQWCVVAYKRYGGLPRLHILIAWGSVPKEAVDLHNDRIL